MSKVEELRKIIRQSYRPHIILEDERNLDYDDVELDEEVLVEGILTWHNKHRQNKK